ncbi:biopolymer transporter ExbB [Limnohabitans sp. MMS-10A-160]|uniref:MotA/TolQ/ExbB proton channel family protein n=1 Tax=unclassified Limnohabitans TaxID=2626134 RepID=UPI000D3C3F30|nr:MULTISPECIES: MotA/TolQ/ExbB proton channel family protein [unclassified Limnohabitans]PUE21896.1 biopolymer transporter ExbB [Limnohabitans sp. MMS-10A-192]PUE26966.1 biopolymer transporter ExbB [Limnohabitans sp. MMS-10A-160]
MFKPFKTLIVCAGLLAALLSTGTVLAAKPKEAAPAAAAPSPAAAPAEAAPAPVAAPAAPAAQAAEEENPYGLSALWSQGDGVAKGTLLILVLMSMGSWYVIFTKFAEQSKLNKQAKAAQESFWTASTVAQGKDTLEEGSAFRFIAEKGLEGASKHTGLMAAVDFNEWVTMSIQRAIGNVQSRMQDGLAVLATVGSTAPFVGLFGTVWGIYHALVKIGMSGQASIDKVAGPVGEALIMTAIGLAVAVPAVLGYNWLVRRNKAVMEQVNAFGSDLHAVLLGSAKK